MNKVQFLNELKRLLQPLPEAERNDILSEYDMHIQFAIENGKTEKEAVAALGSCTAIAKEILQDEFVPQAASAIPVSPISEKEKTNSTARTVFATFALLFFNLVVVVGPVAGIFGAIVGLFGASVGCLLSPLAVLYALFTGQVHLLMALFVAMATGAFGYLLMAGTYFLAKGFIGLLGQYAEWNKKIIRGGTGV